MLPASEEQRRRLSVHAGSSLGVARLARSTWQKSAQTSNRRIHQKSLLMSLASHALHAKGVTCETNFKVESLSIPAVTKFTRFGMVSGYIAVADLGFHEGGFILQSSKFHR